MGCRFDYRQLSVQPLLTVHLCNGCVQHAPAAVCSCEGMVAFAHKTVGMLQLWSMFVQEVCFAIFNLDLRSSTALVGLCTHVVLAVMLLRSCWAGC